MNRAIRSAGVVVGGVCGTPAVAKRTINRRRVTIAVLAVATKQHITLRVLLMPSEHYHYHSSSRVNNILLLFLFSPPFIRRRPCNRHQTRCGGIRA